MQPFLRITAIVLLTLRWTEFGWSADDAALRSVVDKAIQAHGGADKLARFQASTAKLKGTVSIGEQKIAFTGDLATQGGDQQRIEVSLNVDGQALRVFNVLNRDRGWVKINDTLIEMGADKLADARAKAQADWLATLLPLTDKSVTLSAMGEMVIDGRAAIGINASRPGSRDVGLLFDKETHRLVKTQSQTRDEGTEQLVSEETFLSDYKEIEGTQQPMKFVIKHDGKLHAELEVTELKPQEKLDDSVFAAP
jgi:hypothetical protein